MSDEALVKIVSQAIHQQEWCPVPEECSSGTSATSNAHARVALAVIRANDDAFALAMALLRRSLHGTVLGKELRADIIKFIDEVDLIKFVETSAT